MVSLNIWRGGIAVEELLRCRVVDQPVWMGEVGQQTHRQFTGGALETRYNDLLNLPFGIGATSRVVSQVRQTVQLAASWTSPRCPNREVGSLLDVLLDRLCDLYYNLHKAG